MKNYALIVACVFPFIPLWLLLDHLAELKYRTAPASKYWESRLNNRPEFFRSEGFVWFAPPEIYFHGYWPRRTPEKEIDAAFYTNWNGYISRLVLNTNQWDTNTVQKLCLLTGTNFGANQAAWANWNSEKTVTKEQALLLLERYKIVEPELAKLFSFHVRNRHWFAVFESAFFCLLWAMIVLLPRMRLARSIPILRWGLIGYLFSAVAFLPSLFGYADGAFTTWQGPEALSYSGGYLWRGEFVYGNSIAYRTFFEILGSPPLWTLQHLRINFSLDQINAFFYFIIFYALASAVITALISLLVAALKPKKQSAS